jgi:hypothetical protein
MTTTYRVTVPAMLCFDVRASRGRPGEALRAATAVCTRLWEEGADVPDCDLENGLQNATCYPQPNHEPVEILDEAPEKDEALAEPWDPAAIRAQLVAEGVTEVPFGHFETDGGMEVERDTEVAPAWFTDAHAVLLHRVECGCLCPENKEREDFYGGRTQMPFPTFSATAEDL